VTQDPRDQQIEVAKQELIEGKLCPLSHLLPNNVLYYHYSIALHGFGIIFHYVHVPIILLFYLCSCQDH
jgi:hypothetical protein